MHKYLLVCLLILLFGSLRNCATAQPPSDTLRVLSFNMWQGGEAGGQPLSQSQRLIEASQADVVGLQETRGAERDGVRPDKAKDLAAELGWRYFDQGDATGVLSRYPIVDHTANSLGVQIELPSGRRVWFFNVHLAHAPYQPYQLLDIPYADAPFLNTSDEAVKAARAARGAEVTELLDEISAVADEDVTVFITGDFNEPSALDWTASVRNAGRCPHVIDWPTTRAVLDAGFVDTYRVAHPDPLKSPGYTWTPLTTESDPNDHHDRIDMVFVRGNGVGVQRVQIVGENAERADIVVAPYPSDHRAVATTVVIE